VRNAGQDGSAGTLIPAFGDSLLVGDETEAASRCVAGLGGERGWYEDWRWKIETKHAGKGELA